MASTESAPTVHRVFAPPLKQWMPPKRRKNLVKLLALRKFGLPAKELALQTKRRERKVLAADAEGGGAGEGEERSDEDEDEEEKGSGSDSESD